MSLPSRDQLRADLARFDEMQKKVVGGVLAVMFRTPDRVRDREWIVEQFTQVALLTGEFEGVEAAQQWVREHIDATLNACYALFLHVADDLRSRDETERTASEAMLQALNYFG
ncbi:MAG: hypothetical protein AAGB93_16265 [Planctomycetota bacterium]